MDAALEILHAAHEVTGRKLDHHEPQSTFQSYAKRQAPELEDLKPRPLLNPKLLSICI